jgi:predicted nucleic acid-binding protein
LIVLDNSVLSAFKRLRRLGIIKDLFQEVVIPTAVYREFVQGWGTGSLPAWVSVRTLGEGDMEEFGDFSLGEGESQAIVLAKCYGWLLGRNYR